MTHGDGEELPEPLWLVAANVVRWRRYGKGGQELRPGTRSCRGGSKVYVIASRDGLRDLTTIARGRHTGAYITISMPPRHLHNFRAALVHSPTVLRRYAASDRSGWGPREQAEEWAARLESLAAEHRAARWPGTPHPTPCRCHECLTALTPG